MQIEIPHPKFFAPFHGVCPLCGRPTTITHFCRLTGLCFCVACKPCMDVAHILLELSIPHGGPRHPLPSETAKWCIKPNWP